MGQPNTKSFEEYAKEQPETEEKSETQETPPADEKEEK